MMVEKYLKSEAHHQQKKYASRKDFFACQKEKLEGINLPS